MFNNHPLLLIVDMLLLAIMSLFVFIAWYFNKNYKGIREWFFAFLCATMNLLLFILHPPVEKIVATLYLDLLLMATGLFAFLGCRRYIGNEIEKSRYFFSLIGLAAVIGAYYSESNGSLGFALSSIIAGGFCISGGIILWKGGFANHPIRYGLSGATVFHGIFMTIRPLLFTSPAEALLMMNPKLNGFVIILFEQIIICPILALLVILLMNEDGLRLLRIQAEYDHLTYLRNRGSFFTQLRKAANLSTRLKTPLSVLAIDIDHFKSINDIYGHSAGDEALKAFARSAEQCIRDGDSAGRIGGEEFSIFLMNSSPEQAEKIAKRLQNLLADSPVTIDGNSITYTISIGIACFDGTQSIESVITDADKALYAAKRDGRNKISHSSQLLSLDQKSTI